MERRDLVGVPPGVLRDLEKDYRPAFSALGLDFNTWMSSTTLAAEVAWSHKRVGRLWGASAFYAERKGLLRRRLQTRSLSEAETDLRAQLDQLLIDRPWDKSRRDTRGARPKR